MRCLVLAGLLAIPVPVAAEVSIDRISTCIDDALSREADPTACLTEALAPCASITSETPAVASVCFRAVRDTFNSGIAARLDTLRQDTSGQMSAIAGIEVKYDLLGALLQCDRLEELALLGDAEIAQIQRRSDQCTARATGMTYLRLLWRARDL